MNILHTHYLDTVESTNTFLKTLETNQKSNGLLVYTYNQTKGRGRRENQWDSREGEDIALSIYHLAIQETFTDLMWAALSVVKTLKEYAIEASIKLPNDIYVNNQKIAGILIENTLHSNKTSTIIGIGININSSRKNQPNEISMIDVLGKTTDKDQFLKRFIKHYNAIDAKTLYYNFKSHINLHKHACTYANQDYTLIDINTSFVCMLEQHQTRINVPCQKVTFQLKK